MAVLPSGPGRRRTCNRPGKNRELCRLSYGAKAPTGPAPTQKDARALPVRPTERGRQGSNLRRPAFQAGALPAELRPHRWARLESNQRPLVCKTSALAGLSYSPKWLRDKGSNLDLHVQSVASCRLDDPGPNVMTRLATAKRCFPSRSPTLRPWITNRWNRSASYVEELWSPILDRSWENAHAKAHAVFLAPFAAPSAE